jgi:hypothetical protein
MKGAIEMVTRCHRFARRFKTTTDEGSVPVKEPHYQVWCNNALWSGSYTLENALRRIGDLSGRTGIDKDRSEWVIRIVKINDSK